MMKSNDRKIENLVSPLLFAIFAFCILFVLLTGAQAYRAVTERDNAAFDSRTAAQYIATRIRSADESGMLEVGELDGCSALILSESVEGKTYHTFVYAYEGYLCELFTAEDSGLGAPDGEPLFPLESLTFSEEGDCVSAALSDTTLTFLLRSNGEVPNE